MVDISGLGKGAVLAALYNASRPLGMGRLFYDPKPMTVAEGDALIAAAGPQPYFDYVKGRVVKVWLREDSADLDPRLFDRDNGEGAAQRAIHALRAGQ